MRGKHLTFFVVLSCITCRLICGYSYERQPLNILHSFVLYYMWIYLYEKRSLCGYSYERQPLNILHSFVLYYMWIYLYEKRSLNVLCSFNLYCIWVGRCHLHFERDYSLHKHRHLRKHSKYSSYWEYFSFWMVSHGYFDVFCSGEITINWCFLIFNLGFFTPLPFAASTLKVEEVSFWLLWCEQWHLWLLSSSFTIVFSKL
jgi:hypothetical protein